MPSLPPRDRGPPAGDRREGRLKRIVLTSDARKASALLVVAVVGAGLGLLLHVTIARLGGASVYALVSVLIAYLNVAATGALLGFDALALRLVPLLAATDKPRLSRFISRGSQDLLVVSLCLAASAVLFAYVSNNPLLQSDFPAVVIAASAIPIIALARFRSAVVLAVERPLAATLPERVGRDAVTLLALAVAWSVGLELGATFVMAAFVSACLLSLVAVLVLQPRLSRKNVASTVPIKAGNDHQWRGASLQLALASTLYQMLQRLPLLVGSFLYVDPDALAALAASLALAELAGFPILAIAGSFTPKIMRLQAAGESAALARLYGQTIVLGFAASFLIGFGLWLVSPLLLGLFGVSPVDVTGVLLWLVLAQIGRSSLGLCAQLLIALSQYKSLVAVYGFGVLLNTALLCFFGTFATAAALTAAYAAGIVATHAVLAVTACRRLGPDFTTQLLQMLNPMARRAKLER